jgi:hypothetical protein
MATFISVLSCGPPPHLLGRVTEGGLGFLSRLLSPLGQLLRRLLSPAAGLQLRFMQAAQAAGTSQLYIHIHTCCKCVAEILSDNAS